MNCATGKPLTVTAFRNYAATSKTEAQTTVETLMERIRLTSAGRKDQLPWLKLARFGDLRTVKGSLRHDANVIAITGIEGDYDGGQFTFDEAVELLTKQGVFGIVYTSPSHTDAAPRWRALCPLSEQMPPGRRDAYMGRLNGLFRGIFAGESWTLSQAYYYGSVNRNPAHRVEVIEGHPIDAHDDLDTIWRGKTAANGRTNGAREPAASANCVTEDAELIRRILTGEGFHVELTALAARYVGRNIPPGTVVEMLRGLMWCTLKALATNDGGTVTEVSTPSWSQRRRNSAQRYPTTSGRYAGNLPGWRFNGCGTGHRARTWWRRWPK